MDNTPGLDEIIKHIAQLWHPLTAEQLDCLRESVSVRHFKKNETIYKECEWPADVMCLVEGKVKIFKKGIDDRDVIIRVVKPYEFIGYRAIIVDEYYQTSAVAFDDSTIAYIPDPTVKRLVNENPHVALFFMRHLATLLGTSDERIVNRTQKHIRGRLAETLILLKEKYGVRDDGQTLCANMNREDLASMSNMTTSNAIRTLSAFASEGVITLVGKNIVINDEEELAAISRMG